MRRKTIAELEEQVKRLQPYEEAFTCMMQGLNPVTVHSDEQYITVVGMERAAGGVVIGMNGNNCGVMWVSDVMPRWAQGGDPYLREIASKLSKLQIEYLDKREDYIRKMRSA